MISDYISLVDIYSLKIVIERLLCTSIWGLVLWGTQSREKGRLAHHFCL